MIISVMSPALSENSNFDITFQGVQFGENGAKAVSMLNEKGTEFYIHSFQYMGDLSIQTLVPSSSYGMSWGNAHEVNTYGSGWTDKPVAGYIPTSIEIYFVCVPEGNTIIRDIDHAVLCGGYYEFSSASVNEMFDDLKIKLTKVYGTPSDIGDENILYKFFGEPDSVVLWTAFSVEEYFAVWEGNNGYIVLCRSDYTDEDSMYDDTVSITYISKDIDSLVEKAVKVATKQAQREAYEEESQIYGNDDTDGL